MPRSAFALIQPFIDQWEGGYVDHPKDPGGVTNMGITQATLARWRGHPVSKADVKALARAEAWAIMKANYFDAVRGDELPVPVAAATYNAAVLSGPGRAIRFLQLALNRLGRTITLTGKPSRTLVAAAASVEAHALAAACLDAQEAYLRSLKTFPTFGKGWMRRLDAMRAFAARLPATPPSAAHM